MNKYLKHRSAKGGITVKRDRSRDLRGKSKCNEISRKKMQPETKYTSQLTCERAE